MIDSEMDCSEICAEMSQIRRQLKDWIVENGDNLYVQNLIDALKVAANKAFNGIKFEPSVRQADESEDTECKPEVPAESYIYISSKLFYNKLTRKDGDHWGYYISVGDNCFQDLETQKIYTESNFDSIYAEKLKLPTPYELFSGKFKFKCIVTDLNDGVSLKEVSTKFKEGKFVDANGTMYYPINVKSVTVEGPIE